MSRIPTRVLVFAALGLAPIAPAAHAHEGHQHEPVVEAPAASEAHDHVLEASSSRWELVLKNQPLVPGQPARLQLFLSDFTSNAPVTGATIALSGRAPDGAEAWTATADATTDSGVYAATFTPPAAGSWNVVATIRHAGAADELLLSALDTESAAAAAAGGTARPWWPWVVGALALVALAGLLRRGATPPRVAAAIVLLLGASLAARSLAHEGHSAPSTSTTGLPVTPGASVYMPKESQFLMRVRTEPARREAMQDRLVVLGRVAPRGGSELEVVAPQSGRFHFSGDRPPVIGAPVRRGQTLGRLTVIDGLPLRASLSGVVTGVFVAHGQIVQAGQKLMTILDPSVVWVHADVFERDIASVSHASTATLTSAAYPGVVVQARRVAVGATTGEVPGAVEAWYEAPNPGGRFKIGALVEVGIPRGVSDSTLTVPRGALVERDGTTLLFVHTRAETFEARQVEPGARLGDRVGVRGRLADGERVVVNGAFTLLQSPVVGAR